jgi:hypothetical protein
LALFIYFFIFYPFGFYSGVFLVRFDGVWVCEFEVWVLWVSKNDLVAGVGCCGGTVVVVEERRDRGGRRR